MKIFKESNKQMLLRNTKKNTKGLLTTLSTTSTINLHQQYYYNKPITFGIITSQQQRHHHQQDYTTIATKNIHKLMSIFSNQKKYFHSSLHSFFFEDNITLEQQQQSKKKKPLSSTTTTILKEIEEQMQSTPKSPLPSISFPPTREELKKIKDTPYELPEKYRRPIDHRIFVNRSVNLNNIEYFGFDMDYTIAVYLSPAYEALCVKLVLQKLVDTKGYPQEILQQITFDPSFAIRGIFLDKKHGNMLKVDNFGFILHCVHGKKVLKKSEYTKLYPDHLIHPEEEMGKRYFCYDTLFGVPEASLYASLVDFFEGLKLFEKSSNNNLNDSMSSDDLESNTQKGNNEDAKLSYWSLFDDVRECMHQIHADSTLKNQVLNDLPKYVKKDERLPILFHRMRESGRKIFLLTNSEYFYTKEVMAYLLNDSKINGYNNWTDFFDIIITNGCKPKFFTEGTTLREVDQVNGKLKLSAVKEFKKGSVYCGGSFSLFKKFTQTQGSEVMYVGDNIFHDIIVTKQNRCLWRTLLVVREVEEEVNRWNSSKSIDLWNRLNTLEYIRAESFRDQDSSSSINNNTTVNTNNIVDNLSTPIKQQIKSTQEELNIHFNPYFGSTFRSGTRESYFCTQVQRYADIYCSDFLNLLYYPFNYYFSAIPTLLPHEREALNVERKEKDNNM